MGHETEGTRETKVAFGVVFTVRFPDTMTLYAARQARVAVCRYGRVLTDAGTHVVCSAKVEDIVGDIGDAGPDEWSSNVCGLPERRDLERDGEAVRMLYALALDEWWQDLTHELAGLGALTDENPEADRAE